MKDTMKRITVFTTVISLLFLVSSPIQAKRADFAGKWYSSSPDLLRNELRRYFNAAGDIKLTGKALGFIVPHAGVGASGSVAAYAYKAAASLRPRTVILIGFTHRKSFPGASVFVEDKFITPLGGISTDSEFTQKLMTHSDVFTDYPAAFDSENSIEMQIPFIQYSMPDARVVLIALGERTFENAKSVAEALYNELKGEDSYVILGSTDMSHYMSYNQANGIDAATINILEKFDPYFLYNQSQGKRHELLCGIGAITAAMITCEKMGANEVQILKYANSGDTTGTKDSVVGYLSAAFVKKEEKTMLLNSESRKTLLKIARDSINNYLETGTRMDVETTDEVLKSDMGAFVTLHEHGNLRGCIGHMAATGPLYLTVRDMAIAAAVEDHRFRPVTLREMDDIDIEISVLTPMEKISDYNIIEPGKHGVMVRRGMRSGVYLPQVATETGWDREEFMNSLCAQKAGIPVDAWKTGDCEIYIFTAEVFGEKDHE